ncbi:hypothetical protein D3C87_377210 [compost metagenome]
MIRAIVLLGLAVVFSQNTLAQELSPQSLFNRCYIQLTGTPVPLGHALMADVKSGKISALNACNSILRKGLLSSSGTLSVNDKEGKAVLNNFYTFHRTWFPVNNFDSIGGYSASEENGTMDIYDATEPALSVTYSVFGAGQKYSDTLTRTTGIRALRVEDVSVKTRLKYTNLPNPGRMLSTNVNMSKSPFTFRSVSPGNTVTNRNIHKHISEKAAMPVLDVGDLVGVRPATETFIVPNISLAPLGAKPSDKGNLTANLNYSYDFFKNHGGGVMGSPIYLMQYYGHGMNMKFNGASKVARRWSQQNMETFLCANLPALRESDVAKFVDTKSSLAFRNSASCVMCHATLDPMAYTTRNFTIGATDYLRPTQDGDNVIVDGVRVNAPAAFARNSMAITTYAAVKPSVSGWPSESVADFHLQQPTGRLYFRSVQGALVDTPVSNLAGLGAAMVETDDYYLCAAKRYFEFMTGIQVPLYDRTDPKNSDLNKALTAEAGRDRMYVEELASTLRQTGSVVDVVEKIMSSPYFRQENYR